MNEHDQAAYITKWLSLVGITVILCVTVTCILTPPERHASCWRQLDDDAHRFIPYSDYGDYGSTTESCVQKGVPSVIGQCGQKAIVRVNPQTTIVYSDTSSGK